MATEITELSPTTGAWTNVTFTDTLIIQAKTGHVRVFLGASSSPAITVPSVVIRESEEWDLTGRLAAGTNVKVAALTDGAKVLVIA